jgi:hypothetical protein
MAKTLKTRAELEVAINAELAKYDVCQGITVAIEKITDQRFDYNWDVHSSRASGTTLLPECLEVLRQVVQLLQEKYDLAPRKLAGRELQEAQRAVSQLPKPGFGRYASCCR